MQWPLLRMIRKKHKGENKRMNGTPKVTAYSTHKHWFCPHSVLEEVLYDIPFSPEIHSFAHKTETPSLLRATITRGNTRWVPFSPFSWKESFQLVYATSIQKLALLLLYPPSQTLAMTLVHWEVGLKLDIRGIRYASIYIGRTSGKSRGKSPPSPWANPYLVCQSWWRFVFVPRLGFRRGGAKTVICSVLYGL